MKLARRAAKTIALRVAALEEQLAHAETAFDERIAKLDAQRIPDPTSFVAGQLAHVRPQIVTSVSAVSEHASAHLGAEIAALGDEWIGGIGACTSNDALKEMIAKIETTGAESLQRIANATRARRPRPGDTRARSAGPGGSHPASTSAPADRRRRPGSRSGGTPSRASAGSARPSAVGARAASRQAASPRRASRAPRAARLRGSAGSRDPRAPRTAAFRTAR